MNHAEIIEGVRVVFVPRDDKLNGALHDAVVRLYADRAFVYSLAFDPQYHPPVTWGAESFSKLHQRVRLIVDRLYEVWAEPTGQTQ